MAAMLAAALAALAFFTYARGLGSIGLVGPDEPRYAEIAAAMAVRHDYITPRLLGQGWFEKPVLYYWLAAASFHAAGMSDASARLPNALLGLLLVLALALFLARVRGWRAAALGAMLAASAAFLFGFARAAATDLPLAATLSFALLALFLWLRERHRGWLWLAAACLGLAVLAKGPVAVVLAAGVLLLLAWWQRHGEWITRALSPTAIVIFFAVCAPWYVWVSIRNPDFVRIFFLEHNVERFATNRFAHPQPFWFFLPVLFLAIFPWSGWSLLSLREVWRRRASQQGEPPCLNRFLWLWVLVPLVFFSASHSKLPSYILPAVPGLVALMALTIDARWERLPRWPAYVNAVLSGLIPATLLALPWYYGLGAPRAVAARIIADPWLWAAGLGTVAALALLAWKRLWIAHFALVCAMVGLGVWAITGPWSQRLDAVLSSRPLAMAIDTACGEAAFVPLPLTNPSAAQAAFARGPCAGGNLYQWRLSREFVYGMNFYLHRAPLVLPASGPWPAPGLVALPRHEVVSFVNRAVSQGLRVEEQVEPPLGASWALMRIESSPASARLRR